MLTYLLFCVFSYNSLVTASVVYDLHFTGYTGKQSCTTVDWQMPFPWPHGSCFHDYSTNNYVQFQCGGVGEMHEYCYSDAGCNNPVDCLGDGSMAPVVYTNGGCMMDFVNSATYGHLAAIVPYTLTWPVGTCGATVAESALAASDQYKLGAEAQVGQAASTTTVNFHIKAYTGKTDCSTLDWQMDYPMPLGTCIYDWSLGQYLKFHCGGNGEMHETCFSDAGCSNPLACLGYGTTDPVVYTNGDCMMDFVNSAAHGHKAGIMPYQLFWPAGTCPTVSENALADSGEYEYLSAIASADSAKDVVYYGLAMIGLLSLIRGFYGAFQKTYKTIPSDEISV